jgi:hypothetical protein
MYAIFGITVVELNICLRVQTLLGGIDTENCAFLRQTSMQLYFTVIVIVLSLSGMQFKLGQEMD